MSISFAEDLYVVDFDRLTCYSPTDMSVATTGTPTTPASVVDFINDPPSPDPSTLSDIDRFSDMITLDSFIPILENLPGLYLDQNSNSYYILRGSLTEADWARLRDYTRTVSKFIVTDDDSKARISPATFLRIARLQHHDMPLLPCLSDLVIVDADASIDYLDLLLTPSLKTLKASCIPDAQQSTFSSFLTAIEQEVPLLQTLILGPGRFQPSSLQTISQFNSLRHLELKYEDSRLPFGFFDNIGSLAMLKTFILDARYVSGTMTENEPTVLPAFPSDNFPNSNAMEGNPDEHGAANVRHSKSCRNPIPAFNQLAVLHVIGWLPLLADLIHRVASIGLYDVSITLIRLSFDELKVSLAKEKAEQEMRAEETRRREEAEKKMKEQEKLLKEEMERKRIDEERQWREEAEKKMKEQEKLWEDETERERMLVADNDFGFESPCEVLPSQPCDPCQWGGHAFSEPPIWEPPAEVHVAFTGGKKGKKQMVLRKQEAKKQEMEVRESLLKEQERLASVSFEAQTVSFTDILRKLCMKSLKSLYVCQLGVSFQCLLKPSTLPEEVFQKMLLLPALESLEVEGWVLDSVEGVLSANHPIHNLKRLLLPLGQANSGISLPTLRNVTKICPQLESFQCFIDPLSPVPEYSIPTDAGLSHGLRILSVGSSFPIPVPKQLGYLIARHLYLLFPKLETINAIGEHNVELWVIVDEFVKMFQTARMDDLNRQ